MKDGAYKINEIEKKKIIANYPTSKRNNAVKKDLIDVIAIKNNKIETWKL